MKNKLNYLDKVAIEIMKIYVQNKQPQSFDDSLSIARISYKQAQAMSDVRDGLILDLNNSSKTEISHTPNLSL